VEIGQLWKELAQSRAGLVPARPAEKSAVTGPAKGGPATKAPNPEKPAPPSPAPPTNPPKSTAAGY